MRLSVLVVALLPGIGAAQMGPQGMMVQALGRIASSDQIAVEATGTEKRGTTLVELKSTVGLLYRPAEGRVLIEVLNFENGKLVGRIAGDGLRLWSFDGRANTYSSYGYGTEDKGLDANWSAKFFQSLRLRTNGPSAFATKVLDDAMHLGTKATAWLPWIPTATVERQENSIVCNAGNPAPNTTTYFLDGDDESGYSLTAARFVQAGGQPKKWDLTFTLGTLPENTEFGFVPPRGARMVSVGQATGGG
ncbi:MAG: hypothetical protein JST30_00140 [Armatimonadetes bacterium]|nr:hypothetical protein [Armatimonadota bacterium]